MSVFPTISVNSDSVMKFRSTYVSFTTPKILRYDGNRKIILSAITFGTTLKIGLGDTKTENIVALGDGVEDDFGITLAHDRVILIGTVKVLVDGVQKAIDDGAGSIIGNPTAGDVTSGAINYTTGVFSIKFAALAIPILNAVISVVYTVFETDTTTALTVAGTAPIDLSAFLKNSPYSYFKENKDLIIQPAADKRTTIAYTEVKG